MRNTLILLFLLSTVYSFSQNSDIKPYVDYLNKIEKKSAKDYILQKFENHDIVILCERDHRDLSQYELIKEILSDDYFKKNVKNLFTEIGIVNLQPETTEFLKTKGLDSSYVEKKLCEFQRNGDFWSIWENYNYHFLLRTIYDINNNSDNQISYFPSDVEFDWSKVKNIEDYKREIDIETEPRDSLMAYNIINKYIELNPQGDTKALVIMNYRHAFKIHTVYGEELVKNTTKYLFDYFGNRATNILISQTIFKKKENDYNFFLIQNGKWDAAFKSLNNENIGLDFDNSIFGNDDFDMWDGKTDAKYKDVFDGFVFYKPIEEYNFVNGFKGLIPKEAEEEFIRRSKLNFKYNEDSIMLKKLENQEFRNLVIKEMNTKRESTYPNLKQLIEERDKYFND